MWKKDQVDQFCYIHKGRWDIPESLECDPLYSIGKYIDSLVYIQRYVIQVLYTNLNLNLTLVWYFKDIDLQY